jgi:CRP-like cAMP-binding protein
MYELLLSSFKKYISLSPVEEDLITSRVQLRKVRKKQWLVTPGDHCDKEYFVGKGCFRAYYVDDEGNQHTTKFATEGWWITDISSVFNGKPATLYVEALEDGEVIGITQTMLDELFEKIPQLNKYFRLVYLKGLANSSDRILSTLSSTAAGHYQQFIQQYPDIEQRVPQYMIASYLGVTPEFFSRIKARLLKNATDK